MLRLVLQKTFCLSVSYSEVLDLIVVDAIDVGYLGVVLLQSFA